MNYPIYCWEFSVDCHIFTINCCLTLVGGKGGRSSVAFFVMGLYSILRFLAIVVIGCTTTRTRILAPREKRYG